MAGPAILLYCANDHLPQAPILALRSWARHLEHAKITESSLTTLTTPHLISNTVAIVLGYGTPGTRRLPTGSRNATLDPTHTPL